VKILLDNCMSPKTRDALLNFGHDAIWVGDWLKDPGDKAILAQAYQEGRVMVTLDKDFGTEAVLGKAPHVGIVRLVGFSVTKQAEICQHIFSTYVSELTAGAIITVNPDRIRIRLQEDS